MIKKILNMGNQIALVESENKGRDSAISDKNFSGLASSICICIGAKVVMTRNTLQIGLSNRLTGVAKDIFYDSHKLVQKRIYQRYIFS